MGVRGWFDGDPAKLFPLEPAERAARLVRGLGGADAVRRQVTEARTSNDLRWGLELAAWLTARPDAEPADRDLLAAVLRDIAQRTTAANIRNWCLTRARDLDGTTDLTRMREHRLRAGQLAGMRPAEALALLRVMLDPVRAEGLDHHLAFQFQEGLVTGLHLRHGVSVVTDGAGATSTVRLAYANLVRVLSGGETLGGLLEAGAATGSGDVAGARAALDCFDVPGLRI
jgi:alkyl sulfatase BDS1-like metallo-beta-lactamase superfamily hydrolase